MNEDRLRFDLAALAEQVEPVDLQARALRTSRRIGIQRAVTTSAAVLVMIAAATGTALAIRPDGQGPAPQPATTSATPEPSPTVSPSPTPASQSAPESTGPDPSATSEPAEAPRAAVTVQEARNANIRIGEWNTDFCPAGTYRFKDGTHVYKPLPDSPPTFGIVGEPVITDVDQDGDLDAVVLITCSPFAVQAQQVIALQRTASGSLSTLGRVAVTGAQPGGGEITEVAATASGAVRLHWRDTQLVDENAATQWRVYRWNGERFRQVDGASSFPKVSVDLKVTADRATLVKRPDGSYQGDLVVRVANTGNVAVNSPGIHLVLPASVSLTTVRGVLDDRASVHDNGPPVIMLSSLAPIPGGKSVTVTFTLRFTGSGQPAAGSVRVFTGQGEQDQQDNEAPYTLTTSGG
ncbi:hypothetical protein [Micromonospora siamensis]|uniref:DUF11 domain-containing protein n=1 Tax=Micromonospora siamensis TaxID=299152 RepID=A0A1C5GWB6_9ACTN|nr:hypothetical protein [Micromonospora siamensis]SCG38058.1 hypothetical protein GA0074704_0614 [Micromonospora siamensis]